MYTNLIVGDHSLLWYFTTITSCPTFENIGKIFSLNQIWWNFIKIVIVLVFKKIKTLLSLVKNKMEWGVCKEGKQTFWNFLSQVNVLGYQFCWFPCSGTKPSLSVWIFLVLWYKKTLKIILKNSFLYSLRFYIVNFVCMWNSYNLTVVMGLKQRSWNL